MRVRVIFSLQNRGSVVPFHHQYLIFDKVNELLSDSASSELIEQCLCFSGIKGQTKVSKLGLQYFSSRVTIVFASGNEPLIAELLDKIFLLAHLSIGNLLLIPEFAEKEHEPLVSEQMKYLAISPIVIQSPDEELTHKRFVSPQEDEFSDLIYHSTLRRMVATGRYSSREMENFTRFELVPDQNYLERIRVEEKKFSRIYPVIMQGKKLEVRGYTFPFELWADPEVHRFVLAQGIGAVTGRGFGMLDLAEASLAPTATLIKQTESIQVPVRQA